jgi:hypothetical protein
LKKICDWLEPVAMGGKSVCPQHLKSNLVRPKHKHKTLPASVMDAGSFFLAEKGHRAAMSGRRRNFELRPADFISP